MALLPRPVMMMIWSQPAANASSTPYWMMGLSTSGSISLGWALVAGRKRVPNPAAGKTALRTFVFMRNGSGGIVLALTFDFNRALAQSNSEHALDAIKRYYVGTVSK